MKLSDLQQAINKEDYEFVKLLENDTVLSKNTFRRIVEEMEIVLETSKGFTTEFLIQEDYFSFAKEPLWNELTPLREMFVYGGFTAELIFEFRSDFNNLSENKPYVLITDHLDSDLSNIKKIILNQQFLESMNEYQLTLFKETLDKLEKKRIPLIKEVWNIERKRMLCWLEEATINVTL